ncbi:MAG: molybdopterin-dependent oxidoreductase [Lysobacterales bacterium]
MAPSLPPGQKRRENMPRFGMTQYANRFPHSPDKVSLSIKGDVAQSVSVDKQLLTLPRVSQVSDFHCVTSWSVQGLSWSGFRFADVYEQLIRPMANPSDDAKFVVLVAQDGYRSSLLLDDLLNADVLLADRLNGRPLSIAHGAPLRLVAPRHYGYKSIKHLQSLGFYRDSFEFKPWYLRWMVHPRGRVAREERGRGLPGWFLRFLYRPMIGSAEKLSRDRLAAYERRSNRA